MKSCAVSNLKKASLELGGKSPLIIFGDFDMDKAVRTAMGSVFFNKGENCIAAGTVPDKKDFATLMVLFWLGNTWFYPGGSCRGGESSWDHF